MGRHLVIVLLLSAAMLSGCGFGGGDGVRSGAQEGMRLPDAEFIRLEGGTVKVSDLRGRPAVINFWATWCGPCKEELPLLQQAYGSAEGAGFQLIAVTDEGKGDVSTFVESSNVRMPVVLDPGGQAGSRYRIQGIPTTFFLDSTGVIVIRHTGSLTPGTLQVFLEQITGKGVTPTATPAAPTTVPAPPAPTALPPPNTGGDDVGVRRPCGARTFA
ncbi:MAG: TlpA disulfide reductase family protein [Chloroflexales bacterium]